MTACVCLYLQTSEWASNKERVKHLRRLHWKRERKNGTWVKKPNNSVEVYENDLVEKKKIQYKKQIAKKSKKPNEENCEVEAKWKTTWIRSEWKRSRLG